MERSQGQIKKFKSKEKKKYFHKWKKFLLNKCFTVLWKKKKNRNALPKVFLSLVSSIKSCTSYHPAVSENTVFHGETLWSSLESLKYVGKEVSPANSPLAGIPSPKWAVLGPPGMAPIPACPSSCHSLLPHHAVWMCRPEGLVLPAKGRFLQMPALWS